MKRFARVRLAACIALATTGLMGQAPDDSLIGVWGFHSDFPAGLRGEISVRHEGGHWHAAIAGVEAQSEPTDGEIRFNFPDDGGMFRGKETKDGDIIEGFWGRPRVKSDPRGTQGYAAPVILKRAGRGLWRGIVDPLPDPVTLFLDIARNSGGKLVTAFRDPEQNWHGPAMQLDVTRNGDAIRFSARPDPVKPEAALDATFAHSPDRIELALKELNRTIAFTRLPPSGAANFFARPPGSPPYAYREPITTTDGWKTERAGALGIDEAALARVVQNIVAIDPAAAHRAFQIHSIAIAWRGRLVLDEYFHGFVRDRPHDMRSASKTFASVMLGAAMMQGVKIAPETKPYSLLAPLGPFANPDSRKSQITLGDLLDHTSGLACDDNDDASPGNEDTMQSQTAQPDWWKYALDLPMAHAPGTHFAYCSANINLAGAALTVATRTWLPELFERSLARPLQFGSWYWNLMPSGEGYAGGGAYVRTRDFLKLGQVFLDGGVWNGRRIVSAEWAKRSTAPHARVSPQTTGRYGDAFAEVYLDGYDAWAWHLSDISSGDRVFHAFFANGNGGQLLVVIPELDLAVMFTAGNYGQGIWLYLRDAIVGEEIIPAIREAQAKVRAAD